MDKETLNILGTLWHQSRRTENANLMEEAIEDGLSCQFCWGRLHVGKRKSSSEMLTVGQLHVFVKISSAGRNRQTGEVPHLVSCSFHLILPVHSVSPSALAAGIVALPWAKECCAAVLPLQLHHGSLCQVPPPLPIEALSWVSAGMANNSSCSPGEQGRDRLFSVYLFISQM